MSKHEGLADNEAWFSHVQGNILKAHGRNHHRLIFVYFGVETVSESGRAWLRSLPVTSFAQQLIDAQQFKAKKESGIFVGVMFSASGYIALGCATDDLPSDTAFRAGAAASAPRLGDPTADTWDSHFQRRLDAVLMIADDDEDKLESFTETLLTAAHAGLGARAMLSVQKGVTQRDEQGMSREPFGFRDGLSNPLFLRRDIDSQVQTHGADRFDARAAIEVALVRDPLVAEGFGSYVVLRKMEQNVRGFLEAEQGIAKELNLESEDEGRAGAMIIGRFRDGTPISLQDRPGGDSTTNNFNFAGDSRGAKCPFHAHIRKVNDRGESLRTGSGWSDERMRRIVRRGFTYFDQGKIKAEFDSDFQRKGEQIPVNGIGTLFLAYQSSIRDQFEHIIERFANNADYFTPHSGVDSLIGEAGPNPEAKRWTSIWGEAPSSRKLHFGSFVSLKGSAYLFAPSPDYLQRLPKGPEEASANKPRASTKRTQRLRDDLVERAFSNRKDEWFTPEMLPHLLKKDPSYASEPVIMRQGRACRIILQAMVSPQNSRTTRTFEIKPGELIVGNIPMGSLGLGKTFPGYLTEEEARASSLSNRDEGSVFGHTVPNFTRVLELGLDGVIAQCRSYLAGSISEKQKSFYLAVVESCEAVIEYSQAFASLAAIEAAKENGSRQQELEAIAILCQNVPAKPATSFHEALQCIWIVHLAQSTFCAYNSLGRLDQVLQPYLEADLNNKRITEAEAVELIECFLIKCAERLNFNPTTLRDQDHLTFGTGIGTQPIYLDQVASCNNFIQNIVLGGVDKDGKDASNQATFCFLKALGGVGLASPTIDVRVHKNTPKCLYEAVDRTFRAARNGHPILFNDETIVRGLTDAGIPLAEARNYAVAGCWEPMLQGKNSFIFGMVNMLRPLECALNQGTLFSSDPQFLIGQKQSWASPKPGEYASFDELFSEVMRHIQFFADKVALGTCSFFILPSAMTPTPFVSMLLDGCLERGVDQSEGGADYNIIANIAFAVPNAANALANIKRFVFEEERWTLAQVAAALRSNYGMAPVRSEYESAAVSDGTLLETFFEMRRAFLNEGPKFGNANPYVDSIARELMDAWYSACKGAEVLARKAFLAHPDDAEATKLRLMANYPAGSFRENLRPDFAIHFTSGSGTFGQYSSMGKGVSASADGRAANESLVPNCSPSTGTAVSGLDAAFRSIGGLGLDRFGCAVVTDIRIDGVDQPTGFFGNLVENWVTHGGSMMTVSVLSTADVLEMLRVSDRVRLAPNEVESLRPYADYFCRVGGWNSGFICLPRPQQRDHLHRAQW